MSKETITISRKAYKELQYYQNLVESLRNLGVSQWELYELAVSMAGECGRPQDVETAESLTEKARRLQAEGRRREAGHSDEVPTLVTNESLVSPEQAALWEAKRSSKNSTRENHPMIPNDQNNPGPARAPHDVRDNQATGYCESHPVHNQGRTLEVQDTNDPLRMVEVNKGLLDKLVEDSKLLAAMRRHGVHHWDGYAYAVEYVYFKDGKKDAR